LPSKSQTKPITGKGGLIPKGFELRVASGNNSETVIKVHLKEMSWRDHRPSKKKNVGTIRRTAGSKRKKERR